MRNRKFTVSFDVSDEHCPESEAKNANGEERHGAYSDGFHNDEGRNLKAGRKIKVGDCQALEASDSEKKTW
jgi:hypothetical protein